MSAPMQGDLTACDARTLVPGSLQRVRQMAALRRQGFSLDEIAASFEVSRERVRQILRAHGGPDPAEVVEARRHRAELLAEARLDELLARWRAGGDPRGLAAGLGLQAGACRRAIERFATDVDRAARMASSAHGRGVRTYSDHDIVLALTSAADRLGGVPSAKEYAAIAARLQLPSVATVVNRMGGWSDAVSAAGLRTGGPNAPAGAAAGRRRCAGRRYAARSRISAASRRSWRTSASPTAATTCPRRPRSATGSAAGAR